jgi:hypothetical protein
MENIIGFIVFLAVAGISVYQKMQEQKKADQANAERKRQRPEDLPEATRRMLYGESGMPPKPGQAPGHDIPVARRKGSPPPMPRRTPVQPVSQQGKPPIYVEGEVSPWQPHVPTEGPGSPVAQEGGYVADSERQRIEELRRKLQAQLETRKQEAELARRRAVHQQAPAPKAQAPRPQATAPQAPRRGPSTPVQPHEGPAQLAAAQAAKEAAARRSSPVTAAGLRRILNNPRGIRQAVVLTEILNPPVSMR